MDLLYRLYFIHSPSGGEQGMSKFIQKCLKKHLKITDFEVLGNQIYRIRPDTPLLVAHMDQVQKKQSEKLFFNENREKVWSDQGIGADDKNGIWIILKLLEKFKDISFIFSDKEEVGGNIITVLNKIDKPILDTIKYGIVFDRRNGTDILGELNSYCEKDLDSDIMELGKKFGYKPVMGLWSDCDTISDYLPCVNLSCGYYESHTEKEYTKISELKNAFNFGDSILSSLTKVYKRLEFNCHDFYYTYKNGVKTARKYRNYGIWNKDTYREYTDDYWFSGQNSGNYFNHNSSYKANPYGVLIRLYYCDLCGEFFYNNKFQVINNCPTCSSHETVLYGWEDDGFISDYEKYSNRNTKPVEEVKSDISTIPTKKIRYWCSDCDIYDDEDSAIIGMADSPDICHICGNKKWEINRVEDEEEDKKNRHKVCKSCYNYKSMQCDDASCSDCIFLSKNQLLKGNKTPKSNFFLASSLKQLPAPQDYNSSRKETLINTIKSKIKKVYRDSPF